MPANKPKILFFSVLSLCIAGLAFWWSQESRWHSDMYCIEKPGTVWNGLAPLPAGINAECPQSQSYRQEVREGLSRVEQYRVAGWKPRALISTLQKAGFMQVTDEPIGPGNYTAFLGQRGDIQLNYVAMKEEKTTLITISGRPSAGQKVDKRQ